jgi:hypothetical protein
MDAAERDDVQHAAAETDQRHVMPAGAGAGRPVPRLAAVELLDLAIADREPDAGGAEQPGRDLVVLEIARLERDIGADLVPAAGPVADPDLAAIARRRLQIRPEIGRRIAGIEPRHGGIVGENVVVADCKAGAAVRVGELIPKHRFMCARRPIRNPEPIVAEHAAVERQIMPRSRIPPAARPRTRRD